VRRFEGYLFILPWLIGFFAFTAGPMAASLVLSFTDYRVVGDIHFTGLANYQRMIAEEHFWVALYNTVYYTFLGVPLFLAIALAYALLLNVKVRGIALFRTIYYLPSVTPSVANAILWIWILNPEFGFANVVLHWLGLGPLAWFGDPELAKPSLILMSLWGAGSGTLVFLAALQGAPEALYEAATIDGAGRWGRFVHVTLPMISPAIFFNLIMGMIGTFQVFTTAYVATGGGPINATLFYVLYLYQMGFQSFFMGYASALAWVLLAIILVFTAFQFAGARRWVYYEGGEPRA
jgi:multiple sugar transport system permease protein